MRHLFKLLFPLIILSVSQRCFGQNAIDTTRIYKIEINGGKVITGTIIEADSAKLVIRTSNFAKLYVPRNMVLSCIEFKAVTNVPGKFEFSGGIGFFDCINIKLKYGDRIQGSAGIGWFPGLGWGGAILLDEELFLHFARAQKSNHYKWYFNCGISEQFPKVYVNPDNEEVIQYIIFSKLGRSFRFNDRSGLNLDLGLMYGPTQGYDYYSPVYMSLHPNSNPVYSEYHKSFIFPIFNISIYVRL